VRPKTEVTMLLRRLSFVALAALTLACGEDRPVLKVGTNGTSFQREVIPSTAVSPVALVPYDIWNRGNATAFIPTCGTRVLPVIEKQVNGQWESYSSGFCVLSSVMDPLELRAGDTRHDEVAIGEPGRFRIQVPYSSDANLRNRFGAVSGQFDVQ
jgi:hypothetical protein